MARFGHAKYPRNIFHSGPGDRLLRPQETHEVAETIVPFEASPFKGEFRALAARHPGRHVFDVYSRPRFAPGEHLHEREATSGIADEVSVARESDA